MLLFLVGTALATTWRVDPAGTGDFETIAAAIAAASDGDEIDIARGTYTEDLVLGGLSLSFTGAGSGSTVLAPVIIGIDATERETLVVTGLTIRNGGRGIDSTGFITLDDVIFTGIGDGTEDGAALRNIGGSVDWTDGAVDFVNAALGVVYLEDSRATLDGVDLQYGEAESGAAIYAVDSSLELYDCSMVSNTASSSGGGLYLDGCDLVATDVGLVGNRSDSSGACIYASESTVEVSAGTFEQCAGTWGAIRASGGTLVLSDATFRDDSASIGPADLYGTTLDRVSLTAVGMTDSGSTDYGALYLSAETVDLADLTIDGASARSTVSGNATIDGLALLGYYSQLRVENYDADDGLVLEGTIDLETSLELQTPWVLGSSLTITGGGSYGPKLDYSYRDGTFELSDSSVSGVDIEFPYYSGEYDLSRLEMEDSSILVYAGTLTLSDATTTGSSISDGDYYASWSGWLTDIELTEVRMVDPPGAGIELQNTNTTLTVDGLSISGGSGYRTGGSMGRLGGALYIDGADVTLRRAWLGNSTARSGGAIALRSGSLTLEGVVLFGNSATDGGGLWIDGGEVSTDTLIIQENSASGSGGALYVESAYPQIRNATLVGNESASGGAIHLASGFMGLFNVIVSDSPGGTGIWAESASTGTYSDLRYDDLWNNAGGATGGELGDPTGDDGNIASDPLFVSFTLDGSQVGDDLHLSPGSPCLDTGYPGWSDADGTVSDIGAYGGTYADELDFDGDLSSAEDGDCDESDGTTYTGATEIAYDGADNDCAGDGDLTDVDGDGIDGGPDGTDCDDSDATIGPGAEEVWYDGVDQDCDGASDYDADGDGYLGGEGGLDCDDSDASVHPGAEDEPGDGTDQDCTGSDATDTDSPSTDDTGPTDDVDGWDENDGSGGGRDDIDGEAHGWRARCGCASTRGAPSALLWLLGLVALRRRR